MATAYLNGRWYDGRSFVERPMWVEGDRFAEREPNDVPESVDLDGGWVVPPFADGHVHWLEPGAVETYVADHLRDGVFYVKDHLTAPAFRDAMRTALDRADSVDLISAHQGFTAPDAHPSALVEQLRGMGVVPESMRADGELYFAVTSERDVDTAWTRLLATRPDFVKVFLVPGGLDPALVPGIVRRAHGEGLRVSAHVERPEDFHVAMASGVDDVAHLPFREPWRLGDDDVAEAGRRGVTVATTLEWLADAEPGDERLAVTKDNVNRLRDAGATIVVGTDLFRTTARFEADLIARLGVLTNDELLHAWCVDTARACCPGRDVGRLGDGAEASFLVLDGDPRTDLARGIVRRVKQGYDLSRRRPAGSPPSS